MYNHELILISYTITRDEIGQPIKEPHYTSVLCKTRDIGQKESDTAASLQLRRDIKFIINKYDYNGEAEVEFEGDKYLVRRTFKGDTVDRSDNALNGEEIELTCEKVIV